MSQIFIFGLMAIAGIVAWKQVKKSNPWPWICAYWILLTIKNLFDWIGINGK